MKNFNNGDINGCFFELQKNKYLYKELLTLCILFFNERNRNNFIIWFFKSFFLKKDIIILKKCDLIKS